MAEHQMKYTKEINSLKLGNKSKKQVWVLDKERADLPDKQKNCKSTSDQDL